MIITMGSFSFKQHTLPCTLPGILLIEGFSGPSCCTLHLNGVMLCLFYISLVTCHLACDGNLMSHDSLMANDQMFKCGPIAGHKLYQKGLVTCRWQDLTEAFPGVHRWGLKNLKTLERGPVNSTWPNFVPSNCLPQYVSTDSPDLAT